MIEELKQVDWIGLNKSWMVWAIKEYGVKEDLGAGSNPRVIEYHSTTTLKASDDAVPWCSSFVNYCCSKAGILGTKNASARSWLAWGKSCDFEPGCIVVLKRGNSSWQGHVGFAIKKIGPIVWVLGGNQSDEVNISKYPSWKVLGYRKS